MLRRLFEVEYHITKLQSGCRGQAGLRFKQLLCSHATGVGERKNMKRKILFIIVFLLNLSIFAQEKKDVTNFLGYNTWYHYTDKYNYKRRTILNNGKYRFLTICNNGKISNYFDLGYGPIWMPFSFTIYKYNQNKIEIHTGEGAVSFSFFTFDIKNSFVKIKGDDDGDVDSTVIVVNEQNQITFEYMFRTYYRELNDHFGFDRAGYKETGSYKDVFKNENLSDMQKIIIEYIYEHRFCSINNMDVDRITELKELLSHFDKPELRILRNLLYAMHGYQFKSNDLNLLFSGFKWYAPSVTDSTKIEFSENEKEILDYIIELEK